MKILNRVLLMIILILSIVIGIFPNIRSSTMYYIMYAAIMLLMCTYILTKIQQKSLKINACVIIIIVFLILRYIL